jgi:hypothetical protein
MEIQKTEKEICYGCHEIGSGRSNPEDHKLVSEVCNNGGTIRKETTICEVCKGEWTITSSTHQKN